MPGSRSGQPVVYLATQAEVAAGVVDRNYYVSPAKMNVFLGAGDSDNYVARDIAHAFGFAVSFSDLTKIAEIPNDTNFLIRASIVGRGETNIDRTYITEIIGGFHKSALGVYSQDGATVQPFEESTILGVITPVFDLSDTSNLKVQIGTASEDVHWTCSIEIITTRNIQ